MRRSREYFYEGSMFAGFFFFFSATTTTAIKHSGRKKKTRLVLFFVLVKNTWEKICLIVLVILVCSMLQINFLAKSQVFLSWVHSSCYNFLNSDKPVQWRLPTGYHILQKWNVCNLKMNKIFTKKQRVNSAPSSSKVVDVYYTSSIQFIGT